MSTLSTHVLDAALGVPAGALVVALIGPEAQELAVAATDADGRLRGVVTFDAMMRALEGRRWIGPHQFPKRIPPS